MSNNYDIVKKLSLSQGSFGVIALLVKERSTNEQYVMKKVNLAQVEQMEKQMVVRASQEAKLLSSLSHANIVRIYESPDISADSSENSILRVILEYCEGGNLQSYLNERQAGEHVPEDLIAIWALQLALALNYLHSQQILHKRIKCKKNHRYLKLGDFGVATVYARSENATGMTGIATPSYCSPENCEGKPYSFKSEIWAYGVVLYNVAAKRLPFAPDDDNIMRLATVIMKEKHPALPDHYSLGFKDFVDQLLEKSPDKRPSLDNIFAHNFLLSATSEHCMQAVLRGGDEVDSLRSAPVIIALQESCMLNHSCCLDSSSLLDIGSEVLLSDGEQNSMDSIEILKAVEKSNEAKLKAICRMSLKGKQLIRKAVDANGDTVLHKCARFGRQRVLEMLLREMGQIDITWLDQRNTDNDAAIHLATARGDFDIVAVLVTAGSDINLAGGLGDNFGNLGKKVGKEFAVSYLKRALVCTPLHIACLFCYHSVTKALIELGANIEARNSEGNLPIHLAASVGQIDTVHTILETGLSIEVCGGNHMRTILHYATGDNRVELIRFLLRQRPKRSNPNATDSDGKTPLHIAAYHGWEESIKELIAGGARVDPKSQDGVTPLGEAVSNSKVGAVELLLKYGANYTLVKPLLIFSQGHHRWYFVAVDILRFRKFAEFSQGRSPALTIKDFGEVVETGPGEYPAPGVEDYLREKYKSFSYSKANVAPVRLAIDSNVKHQNKLLVHVE